MCRSAGATDFLDKPISMDKLLEVVAAARKTGRRVSASRTS